MREIAAYYIPWIDSALDLISTPLALVGGALMMSGVLGDVPPYMMWADGLLQCNPQNDNSLFWGLLFWA